MKIVAIDPGGTTGWAVFEIDLDTMHKKAWWKGKVHEHFTRQGQLEGEHHHLLEALLDKEDPFLVICEAYEKRNNDFSLLISCEYIGVVKAWCQRRKRTLVMQHASQALFFCTNRMMDHLNLLLTPYKPWKDAMAARKHLVFYLVHHQDEYGVRLQFLRQLRNLTKI